MEKAFELKEEQVIDQAFKSLINAFEATKQERIVEFNQQQIFQAYGKIQSKLGDKLDLNVKNIELKPLNIISDEIEQLDKKIEILKELKNNWN